MSEMQSISPTLANQLVIENEFKQRLIERTKNYGITKKPDGKTTYSCKLSFDGSIDNAIRSEGRMRFGAEEAGPKIARSNRPAHRSRRPARAGWMPS